MIRPSLLTSLLFLSISCCCGNGGKVAIAPAPAPDKPTEKPAVTDNSKRVFGLDERWELAPRAQYTASQTPGEVIIKAHGEFPSSNYEAKLVMSPLRIWPPQWMLARSKTGDIGASVMTPFEVTASFKAGEAIPQVRVSDAEGPVDVKVDQARD